MKCDNGNNSAVLPVKENRCKNEESLFGVYIHVFYPVCDAISHFSPCVLIMLFPHIFTSPPFQKYFAKYKPLKNTSDVDPVLRQKPDPGPCTSNKERFVTSYEIIF